MAIPRKEAFACFDDLLKEGLRPHLTGFESQNDDNAYWPKGTEGFFLTASVGHIRPVEITIEQL